MTNLNGVMPTDSIEVKLVDVVRGYVITDDNTRIPIPNASRINILSNVIRGVVKLVALAVCPNTACKNGTVYFKGREPIVCNWCHERKALLMQIPSNGL